jgi:CheY-like chemotaxis protein
LPSVNVPYITDGSVTPSSGSTAGPGVILVVDDDERIRKLVRAALEGAGYVVVEAVDGAEGLRLAQATPPELVLVDLEMPVLDGPGFVAGYRSQPEPHAPIVVMSGSADGAHSAGQLGAVGFLEKPFTMEALWTVVAGFITIAGSSSL